MSSAELSKEERELQQEVLARLRDSSLRTLEIDFGVSNGTLSRIAKGIMPRTERLRKPLGLPIYSRGRVCPRCNIVHDRLCKPPFEERLTKKVSPKEAAGILIIKQLLEKRNG